MAEKNTSKPKTPKDPKWSTGAKVGAAVGSAALMAALLYAGKRSLTRKTGKLEPQSPPADNAGTSKATVTPKPKSKIPKKK